MKARAARDPHQGLHDGRARPDREDREEAARRGAAELVEAGLGSCPGGGAEIFAERVHQAIYHLKISGDEWLAIARNGAPRRAARSNCTMLHGHIETLEERVDHLDRAARLQDETGGFQTYIPLSFHPDNSELAHLPGPDRARRAARDRRRAPDARQLPARQGLLDPARTIPIAQLALALRRRRRRRHGGRGEDLPRGRRDDAAAGRSARSSCSGSATPAASRSSATRCTTWCGRATQSSRRSGPRRRSVSAPGATAFPRARDPVLTPFA